MACFPERKGQGIRYMTTPCRPLSLTISHHVRRREQNQPTADNLAVFKVKRKGDRKKKHVVWDIQAPGL